MAAPGMLPVANAVAAIDEARCIGCTLCIQACPVDAIVGAAKLMHTVISGACTGCELCVIPCPVDCIRMLPLPARGPAALVAAIAEAQRRHEARVSRLERQKGSQRAAQRQQTAALKKRETIALVMARAQARLANRKS